MRFNGTLLYFCSGLYLEVSVLDNFFDFYLIDLIGQYIPVLPMLSKVENMGLPNRLSMVDGCVVCATYGMFIFIWYKIHLYLKLFNLVAIWQFAR